MAVVGLWLVFTRALVLLVVAIANATMGEFANEIGRMTDKAVVDRTALSGRHSFDLQWDLNGGPAALKQAATPRSMESVFRP